MAESIESTSYSSVESLRSEYPLQQHAGKVGYGPNYNVGASVFEKVGGHAQEVVGKVIGNPKLINKGHERHTGENKRRKALGEDSTMHPFVITSNDTVTTTEDHPPNGTSPPIAESQSQSAIISSGRWSSEELSPK